MKRIKRLKFVCELTKCFAIAHGIGAVLCVMLVDSETIWVRVLIALIYCGFMAAALYTLHEEAKGWLKSEITYQRKLADNDTEEGSEENERAAC